MEEEDPDVARPSLLGSPGALLSVALAGGVSEYALAVLLTLEPP